MAPPRGVPAAGRNVNLDMHLIRNRAGAPEEFEQMIADLVKVDVPDARRIDGSGGDEGLDIVHGDLSGGPLDVWEVKYFRSVSSDQRPQIEGSLKRCVATAENRDNRITTWTLCVAADLNPTATRWWEELKRKYLAEHRIPLRLWDASELRRLLLRDEAYPVWRAYYGSDQTTPVRPVEASRPVVPIIPPPAEPGMPWHGGDECRVGTTSYLLHGHPTERSDTGHATVWRDATAETASGPRRMVHLRQVEQLRPVPAAAQLRAALRQQVELLRRHARQAGLPAVVDLADDSLRTTVVTAEPDGDSLQLYFAPDGPPERIGAVIALDALGQVGTALRAMHQLGHSHRELEPDVVVVSATRRSGALRHAGLLATPPQPDEGPAGWQAPEQSAQPASAAGPSLATDVYQLAALAYRLLTGYPPGRYHVVPVSGVPAEVDAMLAQCLRPRPQDRPTTLDPLLSALRELRRSLMAGGAR